MKNNVLSGLVFGLLFSIGIQAFDAKSDFASKYPNLAKFGFQSMVNTGEVFYLLNPLVSIYQSKEFQTNEKYRAEVLHEIDTFFKDNKAVLDKGIKEDRLIGDYLSVYLNVMKSKIPTKEDIAQKVDFITTSYPRLAQIQSTKFGNPLLEWANSTDLSKEADLVTLINILNETKRMGINIQPEVEEAVNFSRTFSNEIPKYIQEQFKKLQDK